MQQKLVKVSEARKKRNLAHVPLQVKNFVRT